MALIGIPDSILSPGLKVVLIDSKYFGFKGEIIKISHATSEVLVELKEHVSPEVSFKLPSDPVWFSMNSLKTLL